MSIFYKIISPQNKVSYLFGTIHRNDKAFVTLPKEVVKAFEQATVCVFETDLNNIDPYEAPSLFNEWIRAQTQYLGNIPQDYLESAKKNLKKILDKVGLQNPVMGSLLDGVEENIEQLSPLILALWMMGIDSQQADPHRLCNFLDQQLINLAAIKNKQVGYLESIEEQISKMLGFNLNFIEQIEFYRFIESELLKGAKFQEVEPLLISAYQKQDIESLQKIAQLFHTATDVPEVVHRYYDGLSADRDLIMAERMKDFLDNENAFVAVGAGHVKGIIDILQTEGYKIEAVALGKRDTSIASAIVKDAKTSKLGLFKREASIIDPWHEFSVQFKKIAISANGPHVGKKSIHDGMHTTWSQEGFRWTAVNVLLAIMLLPYTVVTVIFKQLFHIIVSTHETPDPIKENVTP